MRAEDTLCMQSSARLLSDMAEEIIMTARERSPFICPVCKAGLYRNGGSLFCGGARRHCYDISSSGYVNLLSPGRKSNRGTGDDGEMIGARRRFLKAGHYDRISDAAADLLLSCLCKKGMKLNFFADAGSGEGYHTLRLFKILSESFPNLSGVGLDASKKGADCGARHAKIFPDLHFAAANIFDMPLEDSCADAVFSLFAPVPDGEAARILAGGRLLLVCSSGSRHLWQMRELLYGEPRLSPPLDRTPEGFSPYAASSLSYEITLSGDEIKDLFTMTPFYYRCPHAGRERLMNTEKLTTEISVEYKVYEKK